MQGTCEVCKNQYEKRQESQRFCSKRCKNRDYYARNKAAGKVYTQVRPPAPPAPPVVQPQQQYWPPATDNLFLGFIQNQNQQLTAENARIKAEFEKLQQDHNKILIEKGTWDQLAALEKAKVEAEKRDGLAGFAESPVGERLLGIVEQIVVKKFGSDTETETVDFFAGVDEGTAEGLKTLCKQLENQTPEFIGKVMAVVQLWVKYPQMLEAAVQSLEQIKAQLKGTQPQA